jgi:imidazolonepropionase-like amidohydrolase
MGWALALSMAMGTAGAGQGLAIVGATVIDGTGAPPQADAIVLVEGDRIKAVGPRALVALPKGVPLIDGRSRYVVPGVLADPSAAREAKLLTARGLTPLQAMAALVRRLDKGRANGSIEPGKRADLLILDKDPLVDVGNLAAIVRVIKGGALAPASAPGELL